MAIVVKAGGAGQFRGKIGDVVITQWLDLVVAKDVPATGKGRKHSKKNSRAEKKFAVVEKFFTRAVLPVIARGYQFRNKQEMTGRNACSSYHLINAVAGEYPLLKIDLSKVQFTRAFTKTETGWNASLEVTETGSIDVKWELNIFPEQSTRFDDEAIAVFYHLNLRKFCVLDSKTRRDLVYHFKNQEAKTGEETHCWLLFISADGKRVSETSYLGAVIR